MNSVIHFRLREQCVELSFVSYKLFMLGSYKLNPRTLVFVGYSDKHMGLHDLRLTQTNRTFFIKLGYAWTF